MKIKLQILISIGLLMVNLLNSSFTSAVNSITQSQVTVLIFHTIKVYSCKDFDSNVLIFVLGSTYYLISKPSAALMPHRESVLH